MELIRSSSCLIAAKSHKLVEVLAAASNTYCRVGALAGNGVKVQDAPIS